PPAYPFFLAALGCLGIWSAVGVTAVQIILDSIAALLLLQLAQMVVSARWALGVALCYSLFPGAIDASRSVLTETLFTFLLLTAVLLLLRGVHANRPLLTCLAGAVLGGAILCRSIAVLYPLLLPLAILWFRKTPLQPRLHVAMLLVGAVLV